MRPLNPRCSNQPRCSWAARGASEHRTSPPRPCRSGAGRAPRAVAERVPHAFGKSPFPCAIITWPAWMRTAALAAGREMTPACTSRRNHLHPLAETTTCEPAITPLEPSRGPCEHHGSGGWRRQQPRSDIFQYRHHRDHLHELRRDDELPGELGRRRAPSRIAANSFRQPAHQFGSRWPRLPLAVGPGGERRHGGSISRWTRFMSAKSISTP